MKAKLIAPLFFWQFLVSMLFLFALSGGMPFLDFRYLKPHPDLKRFIFFVCWVAGLAAAAYAYGRDPSGSSRLEPVKSLTLFFSLPSAVSLGILYAAYSGTQILSLVFMQAGLETALWDLGFFDQVLWNTAFADYMVTSVRGGLHVYVEHFKPILILIAQLYKLVPSIYALFAAGACLAALSFFGLYRVARQITLNHATALTFAICLFFFAPLRNGINFPFHSQTLADPFLLFGFYFLLRTRFLPAALFLLLAMMCKQNIILAVLGIGAFAVYRRMPGGWGIVLGALLYLSFYLGFIEPNYRYEHHSRDKWTFFSYLLSGNLEGWKRLLEPNPVVFLARVTGPFLFLTFFCRGWVLLLGPLLLMHFLSSYEGLRNTSAHYTAGLNALVMISSVYGFARLHEKIKPLWGKVSALSRSPFSPALVMRGALFVSCAFFFSFPQLFDVQRHMAYASRQDYQDARKIIAAIPSEYAVLTTERFAPHLSHRRYLYVFFTMFEGTPYEKQSRDPDLVVVDKERISGSGRQYLQSFIARGYRLLLNQGIVEIYARPELPALKESVLKAWDETAQETPGYDYLSLFKLVFAGGYIALVFLLIRSCLRAALSRRV